MKRVRVKTKNFFNTQKRQDKTPAGNNPKGGLQISIADGLLRSGWGRFLNLPDFLKEEGEKTLSRLKSGKRGGWGKTDCPSQGGKAHGLRKKRDRRVFTGALRKEDYQRRERDNHRLKEKGSEKTKRNILLGKAWCPRTKNQRVPRSEPFLILRAVPWESPKKNKRRRTGEKSS